MAAHIRRYGWHIEYVDGVGCTGPCCSPGASHGDEHGPPFAYTVGLFGLGHPELLIFGVPPGPAAAVCNDLGARVRAADNLVPGQLVTFSGRPHRVVPEEVHNPGDIVFAANRHDDRPAAASVPVLQLSYDDPAGRFPWQPDYVAPTLQPRPGTFRA